MARADQEEGEKEWTGDAGGSGSLDRNEDDVEGEEDELRFSSGSCVGGTQAIPWLMQEKCDAVCLCPCLCLWFVCLCRCLCLSTC